ncbi:hypothetical protein HZ994_13855 [Akkermansiaceae bacterium]|nr:hypothetical protein HZ994_13855 [Akkermansiaceae bacterium]
MLGTWIAASRDRFTGADFDFLTEVLAGGQHRACMAKLWDDPDALREMLDLKEVFRSTIDSPSALRVSPDFYFYVLVRHAFMQADISNPDIADYVSAVLAARIGVHADNPLQDIARGYTHASDFLAVISTAQDKMKFHLQVAAGNQFLVLTGLFPSFISKRNERSGAPDLAFYESFARRSFECAANNPYACGKIPRRLLGELAELMPVARRSLNRLAEEFVFLGN